MYIVSLNKKKTMKEKIEKVIKEVGINEVESILNNMKSKVNINESLKTDFIKYLTGCTLSFDKNDIDYKKDEKILFYYRKSNKYFGVSYDIWSEFELKYSVNYQELSDLLVCIVEEVLNYKGVTPLVDTGLPDSKWKRY